MRSIIFLCTGNSCRSQIAEAWCRYLHPNLVAESAGVDPQGVNPYAVQVMREAGIDMSSHKSQHMDDFDLARFDCLVTVCDRASESCPVLPVDCQQIHHSFDDPPALAAREADPEKALDHYRRVRDEIREFVRQLAG